MIVQLINPAPFGGLETVVRTLAVALHGAGTPVVTLALLDEGSDVPRVVHEIAAAGVPVERLTVPPKRYLAERREIARAVRRIGAEVVHSHGYRMDVMARLIGGGGRVGWVSTLHGFVGGSRKGRLFEALQLRAIRSADRVIGVSRGVIDRARAAGVADVRLRLVRNAVAPASLFRADDARGVLGLDPGRRWAGWVGRLGAEKDPELFVRALQGLPESVGGVIVGAGPLLEPLRARYAALVAQGRLVFTGHRSDASRLMAALDVLVLSSVTEGTPMVVLEAMQAGTPVVAVAVGGLPDLLAGGAGVLVDDRAPSPLARAIESMLQEPVAAAGVVERARARVAEEFSAAAWLAQHQQLYSEIRAMRPARTAPSC